LELPQFEYLIKKLDEKKGEIDKAIMDYIRKRYEGELYELVEYAVGDGKRLRGVVLLLISEALEGDQKKALRLAISAELGHSASLVHDDIIDRSVERRRKPTLWKRYGLEKAVILPHILISESLDIARREGEEFFKVGLETWSKASMGEYLDIIAEDRNNWPGMDYRRLIALKSGSLFEGAAEIGALVSGKKEYIQDAKKYGMALGIAYQFSDDLVGYINSNEEGGGSQNLFSYYIKNEIGDSKDISLIMGFFMFNIMKEFEIIRKSKLFEKSEYLKLFPIFSILEIMKENASMYDILKNVIENYF
jgi:geranylgeranyl pyrophosphate synthase